MFLVELQLDSSFMWFLKDGLEKGVIEDWKIYFSYVCGEIVTMT